MDNVQKWSTKEQIIKHFTKVYLSIDLEESRIISFILSLRFRLVNLKHFRNLVKQT